MNKQDFISHLNEWYNKTGYAANSCHVSHGGAMLMLNLRNETGDIDLTVSKEIWDDLISKGYDVKILPATGDHAEVGIISATEFIDAHLIDADFDGHLICEENIWYRDIATTLSDKLKLNRSKDQADIRILQNLIG